MSSAPEQLYIDEIDDAVMLGKHAEKYWIEYDEIRRDTQAFLCQIDGVEFSTTAPSEIAPGRLGRCTTMGAPERALGSTLVATVR